MKVLYLSRHMSSYKSASYQQDVIREFESQAKLIFWGPGFQGFDPSLSISDVIARNAIESDDLLCVGHSWLSDSRDGELESCARLDLAGFGGRKVFMLNKEYVRLEEKLDFVKRFGFDLALSHHQDAESYGEITGTPFVFWPFAVDSRTYRRGGLPKAYDLFFSGLLKNPSHPDAQSDLRIRAQQTMFTGIGEFRLFQRWRYRRRRIFWNAYSGNPRVTRLLRLTGRYVRLNDSDYSARMAQSKSGFCTLSPARLISPRYFEAMFSGAIVLCEESSEYRRLFESWTHYVPFSPDFSDFAEKLEFVSGDSPQVHRIRQAAEALVAENHTWENRIADLLEWNRTGVMPRRVIA